MAKIPRPTRATRYGRYTSFQEKLAALTDRRGPNECWPWMGSSCNFSPRSGLYGRCAFGGVTKYAHRATYEHCVGPIPDGLTIDHTCFNTLCQNPAHLEAVTKEENSRRFQANKRLPRAGRVMLTPAQRTEIVQLAQSRTLTQSAIATSFGIDPTYVSHLLSSGRAS
jgi:DNA-binding CsgD family transcriptional regulator